MPWKLSGLQISVGPTTSPCKIQPGRPRQLLAALTALSKCRRESSDRKLALASLQGLSTS